MNTNNKNVLAVFSVSGNIKNMRHLIISSILIDLLVMKEFLSNRNKFILRDLSIHKLIIFRVIKTKDFNLNSDVSIVRDEILKEIMIITVTYNGLFKSSIFINNVLKTTDLSNKIFFLFENVTLFEIVTVFRGHHILVSGGSSSKRHLLSPLQYRLSKFLISLEFSDSIYVSKLITESFQSKYSDRYNIKKDFTTDKIEEIIKEFWENNKSKIAPGQGNDESLEKEMVKDPEPEKDRNSEAGLSINDVGSELIRENSLEKVELDRKIIEERERESFSCPSPESSEGGGEGGSDTESEEKYKNKKVIKDKSDELNNQDPYTVYANVNTKDEIGKNKFSGIVPFSPNISLFMKINQGLVPPAGAKKQFHSFGGLRLEQESEKKIQNEGLALATRTSASLPPGDGGGGRDKNVGPLVSVPKGEDVDQEFGKKDKQKSSFKNKNISYLDEVFNIIVENQGNLISAQKEIESLWLSNMKKKLEDSKYLNHRLVKLLIIAKKTLDIYSNHYTFKKRFPSLYKELNKIEYLMLTFSLVLTYHSRLGHTALAMIVGNNIVYHMYKEMVKEKKGKSLEIEIENLITYNEYKKLLKLNKELILKIGAFFIDILSAYPANIFERSINYDDSKYGELAILTINSEYLEEIKKNIIIPPSSLPMICEPNKWSDYSYGGFLENKFEQNDLITGSGHHKHFVEDKSNLYTSINYLNSIKFGVNVSLLNYLKKEGKYLLDIDKKDLDKSKTLQRQITLKIANTFLNIPFYINTHADFRGRIYTQSFFLSYQSGELSTALLQFYEGEKLSDSGLRFLYIYGANVYNYNNLSKKSYNERVNWVKVNYDKILEMKPEFVSKAESRFLFAAFCLIIREIDKKLDTPIHFPVFLDATCSGIQHFAALLKDFELGDKVNLKKQTDMDKVEDIYSEMVEPINKAINEYGEKNHDFICLSLVKLNRKLLKPLIMTKLYNSTPFGMAQQLKSNLKQIKSDLIKDFKYQAPGKNGLVILNNLDILKIGNIVHEQIFYLYPSLKSIYTYFIDIVRLMIKLDIPVIWITPAGLKITQSYARSTLNKVAINMGGKTKSMVLREWSDSIDKSKQIQAVIPNIIHSLDASHLINLLCLANDKKFKPIISIHDCFGTHPNKLEELSFMIKKEFVLLYTQSQFLENFHERIIQTIKDNQYIIEDEKENNSQFIIIHRKRHYIPQIPKLGVLDMQNILESKYMIS